MPSSRYKLIPAPQFLITPREPSRHALWGLVGDTAYKRGWLEAHPLGQQELRHVAQHEHAPLASHPCPARRATFSSTSYVYTLQTVSIEAFPDLTSMVPLSTNVV